MALRATCNCGYVYFAPAMEAGETVGCPGCGEPLAVPAEAADDDDGDWDLYGTSDSTSAASSSVGGLGPTLSLDDTSDISLDSDPASRSPAVEHESSPADTSDELTLDDEPPSDAVAAGETDAASSESKVPSAADDDGIEIDTPDIAIDDEPVDGVDESEPSASVVEAAVVSEKCPSCGASMKRAAVVCLQCGFDKRAGRRLHTETGAALAAAEEQLDREAAAEEAAAYDGIPWQVYAGALGGILLFMLVCLFLPTALSLALAGLLLVPGGVVLGALHALGDGSTKMIVTGVGMSVLGVFMFCCGGLWAVMG